MTRDPQPGGEQELPGLPDDASDSAPHYVLRLYVTGSTPRSTRAIQNMRRICQEHLRGRYDLEVVDIYQAPEAARDAQIIAAPTLLKILPQPLRRFIGDLSDDEKILAGLDLRKVEKPSGGDS